MSSSVRSSNPSAMGEALGIAYRAIAGFLLHKAGLRRSQGECGAVTLIQRFGSALNLNVLRAGPGGRVRFMLDRYMLRVPIS